MHGVYGKKHGVHSGCGNFMQMAHIGRKSTVRGGLQRHFLCSARVIKTGGTARKNPAA